MKKVVAWIFSIAFLGGCGQTEAQSTVADEAAFGRVGGIQATLEMSPDVFRRIHGRWGNL
jgi:hypothetical protein